MEKQTTQINNETNYLDNSHIDNYLDNMKNNMKKENCLKERLMKLGDERKILVRKIKELNKKINAAYAEMQEIQKLKN